MKSGLLQTQTSQCGPTSAAGYGLEVFFVESQASIWEVIALVFSV